MMTKHIK